MAKPTPKQKRLLRFLKSNPVATTEQIMKHMRFKHKQCVYRMGYDLCMKGWLDWKYIKIRSWTVYWKE